ncbi:MAG: GntR family transcriptional regulator [Eubacterium sp.]
MILIDYHSRVPIYEQIKEQIIMLINTGVYKSNDQLPSIRSLSKELNINVNTIKHALTELESDGVVYSVQGKGIFVCENPIGNKKIVEAAIEDIKIALASGRAKGVSKRDLELLIDEIYKAGDTND